LKKKTGESAVIRFGGALAFFLALTILSAKAQTLQSFDVQARPFEQFRIGSDEKQFGPLEFVGGLEMTGGSRDFGAWSGITVSPNQADFVGVLDTGFWIDGQILRSETGAPVGLSARLQEILNKTGSPIKQKWQADAESIARKGDEFLVGFERAHRIDTYKVDASGTYIFQNTSDPNVPLFELRSNRGFEGIGVAPKGTPLSGALVGISEKSLDKNKNIMGFLRNDDGSSFEFSVVRTGEFDITDLGFLPNGNLITLERRFNIASGIAMRLRHFKANEIMADATIDGEILLEADMLYQIDNMEGLSITTDGDGTPRLTIISDDNHSLFQRNLLLEFRLTGSLN
jgi:hypothetical protein